MDQLSHVLTAVVVASVLALFVSAARRGRPAVVDGSGTLLFRYGPLFRNFARFSAFGIPALLTLLVCFAPQNEGDWVWILAMYAMFLSLGLPLWWETRYALIVSPEELDLVSPWKRRTVIPWAEVDRVSFNDMCQWFVVRSTRGDVIRMHLYVNGVGDFLGICEQRLHPDQLADAKAGYAMLGRPFPSAEF
jgi:hypothetical protein